MSRLELILELRNRITAGLSSARQTLNRGLGGMRRQIAQFRANTSAAFSQIAGQIPGLSGSIGSLGNPYAALAAGAVALATGYGQAARMANDWQTGMAKVNVTAQLTKSELTDLSKEVLKIGGNNVTPLESTPDTFNNIVSAGLEVKDAIKALDPVLKGAKAGFTDVGIVAKATVSSMNSTGIMDATRVLDVLFATMNKGNAEFADVANYLPKIIPMAEKAGQSFEDTAGAFAYFTAQGFKTEQTATLLENAFKAISDPRITEGFKKVGLNIYDIHGNTKPILKIVDELRGKLKGLNDQSKNAIFKTIGVDGEATTALGAMLKDYDKLKDIIAFTNDSQGQLNEAIKNAETPTDVWNLVANQIKVSMIELGQTALPMIKEIGTYVLQQIQYWKDLYRSSVPFRDFISALGVAIKIAFNIGTAAIQMLWIGIKGVWSIVESLKVAIFGAGDGFEAFYLRAKPYMLYLYQQIEGISKMLFNIATFDLKGAVQAGKDMIRNWKDIPELKRDVLIEYTERKTDGLKPPDPLAPVGGVGAKDNKNKNTGTIKVPGSSDAGKVTGSAQQIKNLTINMDAMVKMGDFVSKNPEISTMNKRDLEQWFTELAARMIRNLETSYG